MNFLRHAQISILRIKDNSVAYSFYSDGTRNTYSLSFSVQRRIQGGQENKAEAKIFGLAPVTIDDLVDNYSLYKVEIRVGYIQSNAYNRPTLSKLYDGHIRRVWYTREGMDTLVTIETYGVPAESAMIQRTFDAGTSLRDVVTEMCLDAAKSGELFVDKANISLQSFISKNRPLMLNGNFFVLLDQLAYEYGFTWTIQNSVFYAFQDNTTGQEPWRGSYKVDRFNLLGCEPILNDGHGVILKGMKIDAVLDPRVIPGSVVYLESMVYPRFNGRYIVHNIDYNGSTTSADWKMSIESLQPGRK